LIEAVAAFLALFSAGIFVAHAVDAYTASSGGSRYSRLKQ